MYSLKKTTLAIFVFTTHAALAGSMGPVCSEGNVTVPCERSAWGFGAQGLFLQPNYSSGLYFAGYTNPTSNVTHWYDVDAKWGWGFKLEGSYHFRTGNDVNLNWYHYNQTTNHTLVVNNPAQFTSGSTAATVVNTALNPKWDAVNAEFGQLVHFGEFKKIRFHGGAQYVQISNDYSDSVIRLAPEQVNLKFNGFGPRMGADMSYDLGHGFAMYANGAGALLVGSNKFNTATTGILDYAGGSYGSSTTVIPEVEGKLGAKYTYNMSQGNLSLDIGYLWLDYLNAQGFSTSADSPPVGRNRNNITTSTDFTLQGPYIGLKWLS